MKPSKHFSLEEITCRCGCGENNIDPKLYEILEEFRVYCGSFPMITHCVNRCKKHNKDVGGVPKSKHIKGHAWDGHIKGMSVSMLHDLAKAAYNIDVISGGLGFYSWGIHIDTGKKRAWMGK